MHRIGSILSNIWHRTSLCFQTVFFVQLSYCYYCFAHPKHFDFLYLLTTSSSQSLLHSIWFPQYYTMSWKHFQITNVVNRMLNLIILLFSALWNWYNCNLLSSHLINFVGFINFYLVFSFASDAKINAISAAPLLIEVPSQLSFGL